MTNADLVNQVLNQINQIGHQYGPETLSLALATVRITALNQVIGGVVSLAVGVAGLLVIPHFRRHPEITLLIEVAYAIVAGAFITGFIYLLNAWTWIGLFSPQVELAHQIVNKLLGS